MQMKKHPFCSKQILYSTCKEMLMMTALFIEFLLSLGLLFIYKLINSVHVHHHIKHSPWAGGEQILSDFLVLAQ